MIFGQYDVVITGCGITGLTLARELTRFCLSVLALDASYDSGTGASGANSGIVHAGHDAPPGSNKARFNLAGSLAYPRWAAELDLPLINNGSLVLCHSRQQLPRLRELYERGAKNGVSGLEIISAEKVRELEPEIDGEIFGALWAHTGSITCPYEFCFACAENARANGAELRTGVRVAGIAADGGGFLLKTDAGEVRARCVVNAAGVYADEIHNMIGETKLSITARRGEYLLMEKAPLFTRTLFSLPTEMGKGVLISPTVDGNIFLGPTAEDVADRSDLSTTAAGRERILASAARTWSKLPRDRFITTFSGLRAHAGDFIIGEREDVPGFFEAAGIESPGLSSAPAIAEYLAPLIAAKLCAEENKDFSPYRRAIRRFADMTDGQRAAAIAADPMYGEIVCRCEQVSRAEVCEAIRRGADTINGVKKRTRAGMGRCQGGFCGPVVAEIIAQELKIPLESVRLGPPGSELLCGRIS